MESPSEKFEELQGKRMPAYRSWLATWESFKRSCVLAKHHQEITGSEYFALVKRPLADEVRKSKSRRKRS